MGTPLVAVELRDAASGLTRANKLPVPTRAAVEVSCGRRDYITLEYWDVVSSRHVDLPRCAERPIRHT